VNHIYQTLRWDPTPLGALAAMALSRVLASLNPDLSIDAAQHAYDLATRVGETAADPKQCPAPLADDALLVQAFNDGCERVAFLDVHPPVIWQGSWATNLDGVYETRATVAKSSDGFLHGLEVSRLGGDCWPIYGEPVSTLKEAVTNARSLESRWHLDDC
jgi:hypothetical protein